MKELARNLLCSFGYEVNAYNFLRSHEVRRVKFLKEQNISLVLDVGANEGQFGALLRRLGYQGKIISFEPVQQVFQTLTKQCQSHSSWTARNEALGDFDGYTKINVSAFSQVSSILTATGIADTNYWKGNTQAKIQVRRLDSLSDELELNQHQIFLKVDTQGFEENVLRGGKGMLQGQNIQMLEVELSMRSFYSGEKLFPEMLDYIRGLGFELISMSPVHVDSQKGHVLQYDCIFIRKETFEAT
ncbi:FkbM family methyltransferase [Leptolyngbya sp. FACHB-17]|uniref:FkbM family methyltransferase n=1 Tax=unclassified Leptolyngbya TaxID=2650499 RepID=UPI0016811D32|nr:FkbM family methyltransferase [Leptolyngbya sp. FACHB-17]MBD2081309.1 FkbM family methyltransferase [Leptolyngbya sp. FACHB-17]